MDGLGGQHGVLRLAGNAQLPLAVGYYHMKLRLNQPDVLVKGAENACGFLQSFDFYPLFH